MEEKSKVINLEVEEKKEEKKMKNWSLKKKVLIGMGVLAAGVVGVVTYGRSKQEDHFDGNSYEDDDYEDDDSVEDYEEELDTQENETNE